MSARSLGTGRTHRLALVGAATTLLLVLALVLVWRTTRDNSGAAARPTSVTATATRARSRTLRLVERRTGRLTSPVSGAAAAGLSGGGALLLGGLTAADTSSGEVRAISGTTDRPAGTLPAAVHDAAAARLGRDVYLFGGGTAAGTQSDEIVRVPPSGGPRVVARLPAPSSDQSAVAVGATAYVVGGYTGSRWLDTIVAWRPGSAARTVARLPFAVRYAAVAAVGGRIVIAGGSLESGAAGDAVFVFSPATGRVARVGRLPVATEHAAAAALRGRVYVIGGRGALPGTPTARIVAVDPRTGRVRAAGRLDVPRSDLTAVTTGGSILVAGGRGRTETVGTLAELVAAPAPAAAAPVQRTTAAASRDGVYAFDGANRLTGAARRAKSLVYVPNSGSNTVDVIDPRTFRVVDRFAVGALPQHIVPAWNLRTLYATNDEGNSLTPIDPRTGRPRAPIPVDDPYNLYFTPDGRDAIVVAERLRRLDFRDARTFKLARSLGVPCVGVDHMDFTADGRLLLASCEFSGQMVVVDVRRERVVRRLTLPGGTGMPQDVKLSPDGRIFYVADLRAGGVWEIDARRFRVLRLLRTGAGTHGLYPSRDATRLYVTNRNDGSVSVVSFATRRVVATWRIPGGTPDMGGVSADGRVLWLTGRYRSEVYAISTRTGRLLARIPVGAGPHGLLVWPQPGRYSLGHTGILR